MDYLTSLPTLVYCVFLNGNSNVLQRLSGKIYSLPLPFSGGCQYSLACGHITSVFNHLPLVCLLNLPLPRFYKDTFRACPHNPGYLKILNWMASAETCFNIRQHAGVRMWISLEGLFSIYHKWYNPRTWIWDSSFLILQLPDVAAVNTAWQASYEMFCKPLLEAQAGGLLPPPFHYYSCNQLLSA